MNDAPPGNTPLENTLLLSDSLPAHNERAAPPSVTPYGGARSSPTNAPADVVSAEPRIPEQPIGPEYTPHASVPPPHVSGHPPDSSYPAHPHYSLHGMQRWLARRLRTIPRWGWLVSALAGVLLAASFVCCVFTGVAAGLVARISAIGGPEASATSTKAFTIGKRPTLIIHNAVGNVTFRQGVDGQVVVQATKRVRNRSDAEARRILDQLTVDLTQDSNTVTIQTHFPGDTSVAPGISRSVDIEVTAPQASQLNAEVTTGNVMINQIAGQMMVTTTTGNIQAQSAIFAGASHFDATSGNLTLDGEMNSASLLEAQAQTGNITPRLLLGTPGRLDAHTDVGTIDVNGWPVPVTRVGATGAQAVGDLHPGPVDEIILQVHTSNITFAQR